jgi:hypothetical protein
MLLRVQVPKEEITYLQRIGSTRLPVGLGLISESYSPDLDAETSLPRIHFGVQHDIYSKVCSLIHFDFSAKKR